MTLFPVVGQDDIKLETKLQRILELNDFAVEGQLGYGAWPQERLLDIYTPAACKYDPDKPTVSPYDGRVLDHVYNNGEPIKIGSPAFKARSVRVDPTEGLEFSCTETTCTGIIPYHVYNGTTQPSLHMMLKARGRMYETLIQADSCILIHNWCSVDRRECRKRCSFYFHPETQTQLRVTRLQVGLRRHSLSLEFTPNAEPKCDNVMVLFLGKAEERSDEQAAFLALCEQTSGASP